MESEQDSMKTLSGAAGKGSGSSMSEAKKQQYMWPSRWSKPSAHGDCGAVSCNNIYATRAGLEMLRAGGNAFDAAVAVSLTLSVVEPHHLRHRGRLFQPAVLPAGSEGLGAGRPGRGSRQGGGGPVPQGWRGPGRVEGPGGQSVAIPGLLRAMETLLREYGTLTLAQAAAPAIRCAREGFGTSYTGELTMEDDSVRRKLDLSPQFRRLYLKPDGSRYRFGEKQVNSELAGLLELVAAEGRTLLHRAGGPENGGADQPAGRVLYPGGPEPISAQVPYPGEDHLPGAGGGGLRAAQRRMRRGGDAEHSGAQRSGRHGTQHRRLHPCHRGGHEAGLCGPKRGSGRSRLRPGGRGAADQQGPRGGAVCPLITGDGGGIRSGGGDRGQGVPRKHLSLCSDGPLWERGLPDPDCTGLVRLRDRGGRLRLCAQQRHVRLQRQAGRTHQPGTDLWERQQHPGGEDASVLHGPQHGVQGRTAPIWPSARRAVPGSSPEPSRGSSTRWTLGCCRSSWSASPTSTA